MASSTRGIVAFCAAVALALAAAPAAAQQAAPPQGTSSQQAQADPESGVRFVIGFGAGFGYTNWKERAYYNSPPSCCGAGASNVPSGHSGVATNFKIGVALNSRFLILFHSTTTFFSTDTEGSVIDGMSGGDVQVHFGPRGRSFYVFGGAGYHNIMHFDFDDPYQGSNSIGIGVRGGAGFEIAKYLTIEGHVQHGFNDNEHNPTSFAVTVNFLRR